MKGRKIGKNSNSIYFENILFDYIFKSSKNQIFNDCIINEKKEDEYIW